MLSSIDSANHHASRTPTRSDFQEAERLQANGGPNIRSSTLQGFRYCDLLLDLGRHAEVRDRAAYALTLSVKFLGRGPGLGDIALAHLSLGRAALLAHKLADAERQLNQAVDGLRKAGRIELIPRGLLARAAYFPLADKNGPARVDLDEAMRIATRSGMRLFECDAHLELARPELAQGKRDAARTHLARAAELAAATGYHRRDWGSRSWGPP